MALNCKPGQRAWICVPRTQQNEATGLVQLHGMVVQTQQLHPRSRPEWPFWIVSPAQTTIVPHSFISQYGPILKGTVLTVDGVPDEYLRPFDDLPPEGIEESALEMAT